MIGKIRVTGAFVPPEGYIEVSTGKGGSKKEPKEYTPEEAVLASIKRCNKRRGKGSWLRRHENAYQRGEREISKEVVRELPAGGRVIKYHVRGLLAKKISQ